MYIYIYYVDESIIIQIISLQAKMTYLFTGPFTIRIEYIINIPLDDVFCYIMLIRYENLLDIS